MIINTVFILIILRACYYLFIAKQDPLKSITPKIISKIFNPIKEYIEKREEYDEKQKYS